MNLKCPSCQTTKLKPLDPADLKQANIREGWIFDAYQCGDCGFVSSYHIAKGVLKVRGIFRDGVINLEGWQPYK